MTDDVFRCLYRESHDWREHDWRELLVQLSVVLFSINSAVATGSSSRQDIVHSHHCGQAMASGEGAMVNRSRKAGSNGVSHY